MEFQNKGNYSCHCQKPCYFVRMVQDFCCYPNHWDECKKDDNKYDYNNRCNCNDRKESDEHSNWEQEFELRYWNNQHNCNKCNKKSTNRSCCYRNNY